MVDATTPRDGSVLAELLVVLGAHRPAFGQERLYQRGVALVVGWLCTCGRHTITGVLLGLGLGHSDWTAW